jgi:hypothetical protein
MADEPSKDLVAAAASYSTEVKKRDPEVEIARIKARRNRRNEKILDACTHFADSEEELRELTVKQQKIANFAKMPRKFVPYAITMAHERDLAQIRNDKRGPDVKLSLSISGNSGDTAVILPPMCPPPSPDSVKVIEIDLAENKDDE